MHSVLHLGRTLRLVWRIAPGWTVATVALAVVQGVLPLAGLYMIQLIVNAVSDGLNAVDKSAAFREVAWLIVIAGVIGLASALARSISTLVSEAHGQTVTDHVSDLIHAQSIAVDLEYYEDPAYYDTLQRAQNEAPSRPTKIVSDLLTAGQSAITHDRHGRAAVHPPLEHRAHRRAWPPSPAPGCACATPSACTTGSAIAPSTERRSWYAHWLLTGGPHAKEIRLFGLGELFRDMYRDLRTVLRGERIGIAGAAPSGTSSAARWPSLATFGTFAYIAWQTIYGQPSPSGPW